MNASFFENPSPAIFKIATTIDVFSDSASIIKRHVRFFIHGLEPEPEEMHEQDQHYAGDAADCDDAD